MRVPTQILTQTRLTVTAAARVAAVLMIPASIALIAPAGSASNAASIAAPAARVLDFTPSELRLFKDPDSGKHYWYMTYDVVNNTGQDQRFAPRLELFVDDGKIIRHGEGVPSTVTKQLKEFLGNDLLEVQFEILGEVLQGKEHAKSGLVIFAAADLNPTELALFAQGLSRETEKKTNPKTGALVTLRKTARVDYLVAGEPLPRGTVTFPIVSREWIFR